MCVKKSAAATGHHIAAWPVGLGLLMMLILRLRRVVSYAEGNALENEITGSQVQDQGRFYINFTGRQSKQIATTPVAPEAETQP